jgi:hypothetical protein
MGNCCDRGEEALMSGEDKQEESFGFFIFCANCKKHYWIKKYYKCRINSESFAMCGVACAQLWKESKRLPGGVESGVEAYSHGD